MFGLNVYRWHSQSLEWGRWMRYRCVIRTIRSQSVLLFCSAHWQRSTEAVNKTVVSQTCCHQQTSVCLCVCVLRLHLCVMMMLIMAAPSLTLSAPHFSVSRNPTPAYSLRTGQSPWHFGKRFTSAPLSTRSFQEETIHRLWCSRSVWTEWSNSDESKRREGEAGGVVGEGKRKVGETGMRHSAEKGGRGKATPTEGVDTRAKLSLTAVGPLDNPGILSEINLSSWSCWACHYDVVLALSQWQFAQCVPSSPNYSAVQRSLPDICLFLPVWLSL